MTDRIDSCVTADHGIVNLRTLFRETEYLLENMQASVKDSAVSSRQELEQMQQKVRNYYLYVYLMKNVCMYA